jgi:hypothetical protein
MTRRTRRRRNYWTCHELGFQPPEVPVAEPLVPLQHAFHRGGLGVLDQNGGRGLLHHKPDRGGGVGRDRPGNRGRFGTGGVHLFLLLILPLRGAS